MSFRVQTLVAMGSVVFLVAAFFLIGTELVLRRELHGALEEDLAATAHAFTAQMQLSSDRLLTEAQILAEEPIVKSAVNTWDLDRKTVDDITESMRQLSGWDLLLLVDNNAELRSNVGARLKGALPELIAQSAQQGPTVGLWKVVDRPTKLLPTRLFQVAAVPLAFGDVPSGVLLAGNELSNERILSFKKLIRADIAVFDGDELLATSFVPGGAEYRDLLRAEISPQSTEVALDGKKFSTTSLALSPTERAVVFRSEAPVVATYGRLRWTLGVLSLTALLFAVVAALLWVRGLTRPVADMVALAQVVGGGNLSAQLEPSGGSELRMLGHTFNKMVRDLADQRREILRTETRFRDLIETAPDAISIVCQGRLVYCNPAMAKSLGYARPDELVGKDLSEVLSGADPAILARLSNPPPGVGGAFSLQELRFRSRSSGEVIFEILAGPTEFESSNAAILFARDVTERKQTQARLLLADRLTSVGTLAAGVAHEINNPLCAVMLNLEFLGEQVRDLAQTHPSELTKSFAEVVSQAWQGAERVSHIVHDLKTLSRADEETRGPVNVNKVLESTIKMVWNQIKHSAQVIKSYGVVPLVDANESRLGQVFLNLLVNAAQAMPEGRARENRIHVVSRVDDLERVVVEVRDTGAGIPEEVRARIFEPFFTTKPVGVGTGLGLSICHGILKSFGGEISVESEVGKGTTFFVILPRSTETVVSKESAAYSPAPRRGRILIVDDEQIVATSLARLLRSEHEVEAVRSGKAALELLSADASFDVILCDLMMPDMTGMDLHEELLHHRPDLAPRMIFVSGGAFTERAKAFLDQIANPCLDKPLDGSALRSLINQRLHQRPVSS
ncbi:MAG: ATP-binding protein [Myxococcota bacterium]